MVLAQKWLGALELGALKLIRSYNLHDKLVKIVDYRYPRSFTGHLGHLSYLEPQRTGF